ncbi:MAG: SpoIIE family protein phosphatase [Alphaproteobacteria bacterium]|nr:SpoIIE family protein phosphatase [Alphaproteobacteria bacterium]
MLYLTGDGIAKEKLLKIAKKCQLPLWPSDDNPFIRQSDYTKIPPAVCVISDDFTDTRLQTLFQLPITALIDGNASLKSIQDFVHRHQYNTSRNGLGFLLTGPIIYRFDVSMVFTTALKERFHLSSFHFDSIHLALHEALVNGLIHGNLKLSSNLRQSPDKYRLYTNLLRKRLNTPSFAKKAIGISAQWDNLKMKIVIHDEGMGYSLSDILKQPSSIEAKTGRGLRIIASVADSCTIDNYGREISLSFLKESIKKPDKVSLFTAVENQVSAIGKENLSGCKVLIIEDDESNQALIAGLLAQLGIIQISVAKDGIEGLNKVLSFEPDLIILDITMPKLDGFEVLNRLKSVSSTRSIPVLIQTASDTREARDKTFKAGASDFITKPVNPLEFFARVRTHLEHRLLVKRLEMRLKQIQTELTTAQNMQLGLLPCPATIQDIRKRYGFNIVPFFEPSDKLGGDFWQVIQLPQNKLGIYLCDFSGHGLATALNTFRLHTLIFQMQINVEKPSDFLDILNIQLCKLLQRGQFATFFFGILDPQNQTLTYAGAGSPPPFIWNQKRLTALNTKGLPLGISEKAVYTNHTVSFKTGHCLFMYSDAFTETLNVKEDRLGQKGLATIVKQALKQSDLKETMRLIVQDFFHFAPPPPQDDVSAVLLECLPFSEQKEEK